MDAAENVMSIVAHREKSKSLFLAAPFGMTAGRSTQVKTAISKQNHVAKTVRKKLRFRTLRDDGDEIEAHASADYPTI